MSFSQSYVHITDHSHGYEDVTYSSFYLKKLISKVLLLLRDDCWLGFNCEVLSGCI